MLDIARKHQPEEKVQMEQAEFEKLVERATRGDKKALCDLCEEIAKGVLFKMTCILGNQANVEDVSQEVLIRVCESIRNLRSPKAFRMWLSRIIVNEKNRYLAKTARRGVALNIDDYLENILEDNDVFLPQECVENEELRKTVMDIVAGLPMRQREAVMLHYYDGLSVTEVAEVMDITTQSVSKNLALAREKLRRELQHHSAATEYVGSTMGAVPIGALLAGVLRQQSASFIPASEAYMQVAMAKCSEYALAEAVVVEAAATQAAASIGPVMCAVAGLCATVALAVGVALGGGLWQTPAVMPEIPDSAEIVFSGGVDFGANYVYVNPAHAQMFMDDIGEVAALLQWWIVEKGSDTVLHAGYGGTVDSALTLMQESGLTGEHMLFFQLENEAGGVYKLGSNFYILPESNE